MQKHVNELIIDDEIEEAIDNYVREAIKEADNENEIIPPKPDVPPGYIAVWSKLHSPNGKRRWLIKKKISIAGKKRKREEDIEDDVQEPKKKRQYIRRAAAPVVAPVEPINKLLEAENKSLKEEVKKLTQRADELHRALMISIENSVKGR
jgi:hypothetical protein